MNPSNSRPNPEPSSGMLRPTFVPRPAQPKAFTPAPKPSAAPPRPASKAPEPPPAPRRLCSQPAKASPPPLPVPVLLTDADLIDDEDTTPVARASQPTSVDVEFDCFTRSEPPPESRPQRKRTLLALVTGLVLAAAVGLFFWGRPAPQATSPVVTTAAPSAPVSRPLLQASPESTPSAASSARPRPKQTAHEKRTKTALVSGKKPAKSVRSQRLLHNAT